MDLGALCMQLRAPVSFLSLWEGKNGFFYTLSTKWQTFYTINFFLIAPRDLHYYWASAQPCAALRI